MKKTDPIQDRVRRHYRNYVAEFFLAMAFMALVGALILVIWWR